MRTFVIRVNVIRPVCNALVGKDHKFAHRAVVGIIVAVSGVLIAKEFGHTHNEYLAVMADTVGYGLHAAGLTPFIEALIVAGE